MKRALFTVAVLFLALSALTIHTHAQSAPLPYGIVQNPGTPSPANCVGGGWVSGETCVHATMHCDASLGVDDLGFTYGYLAPTGTINGTVVAFSGGGGTAPSTAAGTEALALQYYLSNHLEIVQVKWDSDWEMTTNPIPPDWFGNIQYSACRPAGVLHYVYTKSTLFQPGGGMCAQGFSAGSAAVVYALSWYGAGWGTTSYLDNVELLSGPVLSEVDTGCEVPVAPNVTVCQGAPGCQIASNVQPWSVTPEYVDGYENYPQKWSNIYSCANTSHGNTSMYNAVWNNMSILSSSVTSRQLSYPNTSMNAWLCANVYDNEEPMNNSSSQGWLFYSYSGVNFMPNNWKVNAVSNCDGPEAVMGTDATGPDGVTGDAFALITNDMVNQCKPHH